MIEVDGIILKKMLAAGAGCLSVNKKVINELNVFPVPDGDTGTNMEFTMTGAIRGAENAMTEKLADVAKGMAKGALLGARGNSGVILSQFKRAFHIPCRRRNSRCWQIRARLFNRCGICL